MIPQILPNEVSLAVSQLHRVIRLLQLSVNKNELSAKKTGKATQIKRIREMALDNCSLPMPRADEYTKILRDDLLPEFIEAARHAWFASQPYAKPTSCSSKCIHELTETLPPKFETLGEILEALGAYALLHELAHSPDAAYLGKLKIDPYEARLLRATGHPAPDTAVPTLLSQAAVDPTRLTQPEDKLELAAQMCLSAHSQISTLQTEANNEEAKTLLRDRFGPESNEPKQNEPKPSEPKPSKPKPKKRKLFTGLGKLFPGAVLLSADAVFIPTMAMTPQSEIPITGSLAGGITAVGSGIDDLKGNG